MAVVAGLGGVAIPSLEGFTKVPAGGTAGGIQVSLTVAEVSVDPLRPGAVERDARTFEGTCRDGVFHGSCPHRGGWTEEVSVPHDEVVSVALGWVPNGDGDATRLSATGRCRTMDADAMARLLDRLVREHVGAMAAGYARIAAILDGRVEDACDGPSRPEGFVGTRHALEVRLPPGRYWIGDPALALEGLVHERVVATGRGTLSTTLDGGHVCASPVGGDGAGLRHTPLGACRVASGRVGIVSAALLRPDASPARDGVPLDCPHGVLVGLDLGRHVVGVVRDDGEIDWIDIVEDPDTLADDVPPGRIRTA